MLKKKNLLLNGLYILTGFRSLCTKPQVKINITALLKLEESGGPTALREMSSPHTTQSSSHPFTVETSTDTYRDEHLLHVVASFQTWIRNTDYINTSSGKAVFFSSVLHVENGTRLACVVSAEPWGVVTFSKNERTNETENTKSIGKPRNLKRLYISTNYCLLPRNQTFILTDSQV